MAQLPFVVEEDVWIDHKTGKPVKEEDAVNGAQRINAGERISVEDAEKYGLVKGAKKSAPADEEKAADEPEEKAKAAAPENKARTRGATK